MTNRVRKEGAVMIKQAVEHKVFGQALKGELTQGENIADLGELSLPRKTRARSWLPSISHLYSASA